jgi:hypothetical protein
VYVTNHEPRVKKYLTISSQEDESYYRYLKSVEEYNQVAQPEAEKKPFKFEKGSLLQKIFDPLATA